MLKLASCFPLTMQSRSSTLAPSRLSKPEGLHAGQIWRRHLPRSNRVGMAASWEGRGGTSHLGATSPQPCDQDFERSASFRLLKCLQVADPRHGSRQTTRSPKNREAINSVPYQWLCRYAGACSKMRCAKGASNVSSISSTLSSPRDSARSVWTSASAAPDFTSDGLTRWSREFISPNSEGTFKLHFPHSTRGLVILSSCETTDQDMFYHDFVKGQSHTTLPKLDPAAGSFPAVIRVNCTSQRWSDTAAARLSRTEAPPKVSLSTRTSVVQ